MTLKELSKQEALDIVIGAKILACGGGGSAKNAVKCIKRIYNKGKKFKLVDLSDLKENDKICIIGMVGGGITEEDRKLVENSEIVITEPMITAVKELEKFLEIKFSGFVATELGPNNSIVPMMVAAEMGKVAINGDCCGRSKPKISISTTRVANISISPFSIVSQFGDIQIVKNVVEDTRGELIARTVSRLSGGSVSVARCPMNIKEAKGAVIPKTYTLALKVGRKVREANEKGSDVITILNNTIPDAKIVFEGRIEAFSRIEQGGFTSGEIFIKSSDGRKLRVWYQNEYLLSWLDNKPFITCPDGLYIVDARTGYGLSPWEEDFLEGRKVTVIARDAHSIWKSTKGLAVFGPEVFDKTWGRYRSASSLSK
jgi:DUF917 family protein